MKCSFRRLPQHAGRICWWWQSDREGGEEQRWGEWGVSILHSHKQRGVGWRDPKNKEMCFCLFWFIPAHSCTCFIPPACPFISPSFHLSLLVFFGPLFQLLHPPFLFTLLLPSCFFPLRFFIHYLNTKVMGCYRMMLFEDRALQTDMQLCGQTEFKETRSVPKGGETTKKPWKCYFSSFTSDSWNVSLTERQTASQRIRKERARSVLNAVTCPKCVSPPGCYDLTMLWVYVCVQMEHSCNWILPLKKAVTLLY